MSERAEPLEPTPERFRELAERLLAFTEEERARTLEAPMRRPTGQIPEPRTGARSGRRLDRVLEDLRGAVADSWNTASPRYMGFIPGGGLPSAALADFVAPPPVPLEGGAFAEIGV